jgi:hypothetical protein
MDWDEWGFAFFMADSERRRAEQKALEEKEELEMEYDQWCRDHGIPPPPKREPPPQYGCGCCLSLSVLILFICGVLLLAFFT